MHQPHGYEDGITYASFEPSKTPRRSRRPVVVGAVLAALTLATLAADRVAAAGVESSTAKAFQQGMDTPGRPEIHVRGFPVLTQLASGTLRHVDISAHDIPADGSARPLPVSRLDLALDGLSKSDDESEALARSAEATAYLSYTDVSHTLGLEVSQGTRPGRINASVPLPLGSDVTVTATVSAVSGNRVAFKDFEVAGGAQAVTQALLDKIFEEPIQLRNIPDGLHLRAVTPTPSGLSARFSGESVTFRPNGGALSNPAQDNSSYRNT
ncbi:LmeA family phospholipid-binding protein [Streptomyces umbrinus]